MSVLHEAPHPLLCNVPPLSFTLCVCACLCSSPLLYRLPRSGPTKALLPLFTQSAVQLFYISTCGVEGSLGVEGERVSSVELKPVQELALQAKLQQHDAPVPSAGSLFTLSRCREMINMRGMRKMRGGWGHSWGLEGLFLQRCVSNSISLSGRTRNESIEL